MSTEDPVDPEITFMQWLSIDQLAMYSDTLMAIERAEAELTRLQATTTDPLSDTERNAWIDAMGRLEMAQQTKLDLWGATNARLKSIIQGYERLLPWVVRAIEMLTNNGVTISTAGGRKVFLQRVYAELVREHGQQLAGDPVFRHIRVIEFLSKPFRARCHELAQGYRASGKLFMAGLYDELSEPFREDGPSGTHD